MRTEPKILRVQRENNTFQHLEVLKRNRAKRSQFGEVFIEGVKPITLARKHGWPFTYLVFSEDPGRTGTEHLSDWAVDLIENGGADTVVSLAPDLMMRLSDREEPSELIAVAAKKKTNLTAVDAGDAPFFVLADRPANPGNLGSILRSCDAFGADGLMINGHGADPFDPRAIRASLGTVFCVPIWEIDSNSELEAVLDSLKSAHSGLKLTGTSAKAEAVLMDADLTGPIVLVLGNETYGMSRYLRDHVDESVRIPIFGSASSLNVAAAATVVFYERIRQLTVKGERCT